MFFKIGVIKFRKLPRKKLVLESLFKKKLAGSYEIFKNIFFYRAPPVTASVFFKKVVKQLFRYLVMTYKYFFLLDASFDI